MNLNQKIKKFIKEIEDIDNYKNFKKTLIFTVIICLIVSITVYSVQTYGNSDLKTNCSYLDPIAMDFFAFFAGLFLFIEGFMRIFENPGAFLKRQFTRIIRISFGVGLLTLHIMQFIHK